MRVHTSPQEVGTIFRDTQPRLGVIYHMYNNSDLVIPTTDQVRESYTGAFAIRTRPHGPQCRR